jgi:hypothetical protein
LRPVERVPGEKNPVISRRARPDPLGGLHDIDASADFAR